ncbi:MAG: cytochrome c biogenesis protein ResB [Verrucomicrobiota bacterium]|nr:cytochrome c biogenesis protein ResB [Verrucomicrobiota bacterium]
MNILATPTQIDYAEDAINTTTAYIEVHYKKEVLGTWLVSNVIDERFPAQKFQAGEKDLEIAMRYKRHYYPFEIELLDFSHEKYPGTDIPFNYSSKVIAHHHEKGTDQQALIYMNHPLRYNGLTFYQASFMPDETATILQVVRNPGWLLPYLSVLMMGAGMSFQFSLHFTKFLKKKAAQ